MPACNDNVQNGSETDVDCGGNDTCPRCGDGKSCTQNSDCAGMSCTGGTCQPTCGDGQKDGQETDVDCGGPKCMQCADTKGCAADADCQSGICQNMACATIYEFSMSFQDPGVGNYFNSATSWAVNPLIIDHSNNVLLGGSLIGTTNFGGSPITSNGTSNGSGIVPESAFLAKFDASGAPAWNSLLADTGGASVIAGLADDASNNIYVNGLFTTYSPLGVGCATAPMATFSTFIGELDSFGDPIWCNAYGTDYGPVGGPMLVDGAGNLVLALLSLGGTVDFGGGPLMMPLSLGSGSYLVKLDSTGKYIWAKGFTGALAQSVSVNQDNNVFVSGYINAPVSLGCSTMLTPQGSDAIFVAKFDSMGNCVWSKGYGDAQQAEDGFSVVDPMGNIFLAGDFTGTINFGGTTLTSAGSTDIFAAKLDSNGNHLWSKSFGDSSAQNVSRISLDPNGQPVFTGTFAGTVTFGGSTFTSSGGPVMGSDIYIVKLDMAGNHLWSRTFGTAAGQTVSSIALDKSGAAWLSGFFDGTLNFGTKPANALTNPMNASLSTTPNDIFLAKLLTP